MSRRCSKTNNSLILALIGIVLSLLLPIGQLSATPTTFYGCYVCYIAEIPNPEGGTFERPICWDFGENEGWRACTEVAATCWLMYNCDFFTGGEYEPGAMIVPEASPAKESPRLAEIDDPEGPTCKEGGGKQVDPAPQVIYTF